MCTLADID